jgi:pyridoxal phosphate enzyme (YggS family)
MHRMPSGKVMKWLKNFEMSCKNIEESVTEILNSLPQGVLLVAAVKKRLPEEIRPAINAGITIIGHNYVQETQRMFHFFENAVQWHIIGHLQNNKVKMAVGLFDMIETIDSVRLAGEVNKRCAAIGKTMPVLIEINSGKESNKTGVLPENVDSLIEQICDFPNLRIQGLMTMGPRFGNPENARSYFKTTKSAFDRLSIAGIPGVKMRYLSMGMSNSYQIAIEEGANMIRIGTRLFGEPDS